MAAAVGGRACTQKIFGIVDPALPSTMAAAVGLPWTFEA